MPINNLHVNKIMLNLQQQQDHSPQAIALIDVWNLISILRGGVLLCHGSVLIESHGMWNCLQNTALNRIQQT